MSKKICQAIIHDGTQCKYRAVLHGLCMQHFKSYQDGREVKRVTNVQDV